MKYKIILIVFMAILQMQIGFAQREYNVCDSTQYVVNTDTTIIAGKRHLYILENNVLTPLYNFTSTDSAEYIRDFDIVKPDLWFTVVGLRYIGGPTRLYKSTNHGLIWQLDTSHFGCSGLPGSTDLNFIKSINNLQQINGDTIAMFMHYYESGIIYSYDAGATWQFWFNNLITHYQGLMSCGSKYYLYGYEGDAFRAWMFGFDKSLIFSNNNNWNSFNSTSYHPPCSTVNDTVNCIYTHNSNLSRCATYNYFKNYIDSICNVLGVAEEAKLKEIGLYPNPVKDIINFTDIVSSAYIYDLTGTKILEVHFNTANKNNKIDLSKLPDGVYMVVVDGKKWIRRLVVKQ